VRKVPTTYLLEGGNLAINKEHKRILELALLGLGIVDEIGRDVSAEQTKAP
jgi:hypothetical protein